MFRIQADPPIFSVWLARRFFVNPKTICLRIDASGANVNKARDGASERFENISQSIDIDLAHGMVGRAVVPDRIEYSLDRGERLERLSLDYISHDRRQSPRAQLFGMARTASDSVNGLARFNPAA